VKEGVKILNLVKDFVSYARTFICNSTAGSCQWPTLPKSMECKAGFFNDSLDYFFESSLYEGTSTLDKLSKQ
jgi:hypothetical protein